MDNYVPSNQQLITEIYVRNLNKSIRFYEKIGFSLNYSKSNFASLQWEESSLFLEQVDDLSIHSNKPVSNIRIMVPDVDHYWSLISKMELKVIKPIDDRSYGLRDFTILSHDGIGVRFATRI